MKDIKDGLLILLKAAEYSEYIDQLNRNAQRLAEHRATEFSLKGTSFRRSDDLLTVLNFACPKGS
jgi:hypothetical protein